MTGVTRDAAEEPISAAHKSRLRCRLKCPQAGGKMIRQQVIVRVQKNEELALTRLNASVACRGKSLVCLNDILGLRIPTHDIRSMIGRSVIDDNDLEVGIGLNQNSTNGLVQEMRLLIARNDDAN